MDDANEFLADLTGVELTPALLIDSCRSLRRNRARVLGGRTTADMVALIARVARDWQDPEYPWRRRALTEGPAETGFSAATLERGLDAFFRSWTPDAMNQLLVQDLGHAARLDQFVASDPERGGQRRSRAVAPELVAHVTAGNLPNAAMTSVFLGLLLRSGQFVKLPSQGGWLTGLLGHSIYQADNRAGSCLEMAAWKGGRADLESALFSGVDLVTATGGDPALAALRRQVPEGVRWVGHGHRWSFAFIAREAPDTVARLAQRAADDVVAWDQLGCLSPHIIYVERGGPVAPHDFARVLAEQLAGREAAEPRGTVPPGIGVTLASRRAFYEIRAANSPETMLWQSPGSTAWTVVFENDPRVQFSCLHRFVYVKAVDSLTELLRQAEEWRGRISTVALAAEEPRNRDLAAELASWGVPRLCPLGRMQRPPVPWRHDGRPALGELVTWCDWED